jgi:hypothetical protein
MSSTRPVTRGETYFEGDKEEQPTKAHKDKAKTAAIEIRNAHAIWPISIAMFGAAATPNRFEIGRAGRSVDRRYYLLALLRHVELWDH